MDFVNKYTPKIDKNHIIIFKVYLFPVLYLHCFSVFSLVLVSGGHCLVALRTLLIAVASLVLQHRVSSALASVVLLQEGGPLPGPETGLLSNTWE